MDTDVLIVGAGPVGLTLAIDLAGRGVRCTLIEQKTAPHMWPKMERCNARSMEIYRRLGLAEKIRADGGRAIAVKGDVSKEADVENLFDQTIREFGRLDILVANSGLQKDAPSIEMTLEDWNTVLDVNLTGQFLCARAALRQFKRQEHRQDISKAVGKIIHMSSVHQLIPWAGHVNYAASKGGVDLLMKTLAQEVGEERIRVGSSGILNAQRARRHHRRIMVKTALFQAGL